jgi:hypothetical protein
VVFFKERALHCSPSGDRSLDDAGQTTKAAPDIRYGLRLRSDNYAVPFVRVSDGG